VLIVKSGRSAAASRAAASHTGALADSDRTVAAMLRQCGVLRFDTVQGMFDAALAFEHLDPPRGDRVAIVTNSGGPAIMATDALPPQRLRLAEFGDATMRVLRGLLPAAAALANPVDTLAGADTDTFVRAVGAALADDGVDAVLAVHTAVFGDQDGLLAPLARLRARHPGKPVVVVLYGGAASGGATAVAGGVAGGVAGPMVSGVAGGVAGALVAAGVPTYAFPEEAVAALGALWRWERWRARPPQEPFTSTRDAALPAAGGWTTSSAALAAVAAAGLPVAPHAVAADEDEALAAAERIGYPVVIKADVADVVHKSDAGLVALDLRDGDAVRDAWRRVAARAGEPRETLVMRHATPGLEILLGAVQDERFGPLVAFGLGGTQAEALADVHFRLAPLTADDADHLIAELRASALLGPFRGAPARDTAALRSALLRLAALADRNPRIAELDVNPLLLYEKGALVVDARMRLASSP
jgi:acyl-CoA synthetase (NDP forming)